MKVSITGSGIAADCCAHLLARAGLPASRHLVPRPGVPALMLSDPALALLRDVFGQPTLFADRPRITRRVVAWGGSDPVAMPHGAIMLGEADLVAALSNKAVSPTASLSAPAQAGAQGPTEVYNRPGLLPAQEHDRADTQSRAFAASAIESVGSNCIPSLTIHTATPFPAGEIQRFGTREAIALRAALPDPDDHATCFVEAVQQGWLFLIPAAEAGTGWLLAIGAEAGALLARSHLIAPRIALSGETSPAFATCPRILSSLQGTDWLACGTAAIAFDPICGDGTAQAIREALLACAVLTAIAEGGDAPALRSHYESMLIAGMRRHLKLCGDFYRSGGTSDWWQAQFQALCDGHDWCTARLASVPEPRYALNGYRLVEREQAA